jgi:hypothetical protein
VNVVDTSVRCWSDDHMIAAAFAVVNLVIYCVVIPMVRRAMRGLNTPLFRSFLLKCCILSDTVYVFPNIIS